MTVTMPTPALAPPAKPTLAAEPYAEPWDVTDEEYHADTTHNGGSMIVAAHESISTYHARYIAQSAEKKTSAAMMFGSLFHCRLLEPEKFPSMVTLTPTFNRRTKAGRQEAAEWEEANAGLVWATAEDIDNIERMVEGVHAHPRAKELLFAKGEAEAVYRFSDSNGVRRKIKPDYRLTEANVFVDVKTTRDPRPEAFTKDIGNLRHDIKCAHIAEGLGAVFKGLWWGRIIAVGNSGDHLGTVAVYDVSYKWQDIGAWKVREASKKLARAIKTDYWREDYETEIQTVEPPVYESRPYEKANGLI